MQQSDRGPRTHLADIERALKDDRSGDAGKRNPQFEAKTHTTGTGERQARRVTSALIAREVLASENSCAPLRLVFPVKLASRWMRGCSRKR